MYLRTGYSTEHTKQISKYDQHPAVHISEQPHQEAKMRALGWDGLKHTHLSLVKGVLKHAVHNAPYAKGGLNDCRGEGATRNLRAGACLLTSGPRPALNPRASARTCRWSVCPRPAVNPRTSTGTCLPKPMFKAQKEHAKLDRCALSPWLQWSNSFVP